LSLSTSTKDTSRVLDPSEISTLLSLALLQSLSSINPTIFPLSASLLYSAHILPNRPAYIPKDQRDEVVIAKSEWKKLGKWMKEAGKEGILKVKENKGEFVVQG
jgi:translation initiation factor 2D